MNRPFLIAEVGQAHEGSLGLAHSYVDALASKGVDAVKFQVHIAGAESSEFEPFRVAFSRQDATRLDYWKRMEFTAQEWRGLKDHCEERGLQFIASPFSIAAFELLESIGVSRYKIGSGEVNNLLLLYHIGRTGKPIILSSGLSSLEEIRRSVDYLGQFGTDLSLLQCTSSYPTMPEHWGLNMIEVLRNEFKVPIGYSDHSGNIYACLAAATLGATMLEFHVVFDKRMFGPDTVSSISVDDVELLSKGVKEISIAMESPVNKDDVSGHAEYKRIFGKSLALNKRLPRGSVIALDDLETKKPAGHGIPADQFMLVVGKTTLRDLPGNSFITPGDIA